MTTPAIVDAINTSTISTPDAVLNLTGTPVTGNGLILAVAGDNTCVIDTWPAGWTEIAQGAYSTTVSFTAAYHEVDGTEGATITATANVNDDIAARCFEIDATSFDALAPEAATVSSVSGTSLSLNSITHSHGSGDYLFICAVAGDSIFRTFTTPPTGYGSNSQFVSVGSTILWAHKQEAASDGAESGLSAGFSAAEQFAGTIIAIPEYVAAGGGGSPWNYYAQLQ